MQAQIAAHAERVDHSIIPIPARTPERIVAHPAILTLDIEPFRAWAVLGLVDPEAADEVTEADSEPPPALELDALDDADADEPDGLDVGSDAVVALPTNPTPNARVDSPSRAHWRPPIR